MTVSLCSTYLGPVAYYASLLPYDRVRIEMWEHWQKQTYRNRCYIDGPNGVLLLTVPLESSSSRQLFKEVKISYRESWVQKHRQSLITSYNAAPFFDVLGQDLFTILERKPVFLADLNLACMEWVLDGLQHPVKPELTGSFEQAPAHDDRRNDFHPKTRAEPLPPYPQVFDHKYGFRSNLSIADLLFNEGPAAPAYLHSL